MRIPGAELVVFCLLRIPSSNPTIIIFVRVSRLMQRVNSRHIQATSESPRGGRRFLNRVLIVTCDDKIGS